MLSVTGLRRNTPAATKDSWQTLQQAQILDCAAEATDESTGLRPVFPGAMLFNQILVPTNSVRYSYDEVFCAPESLSAVYEYCSFVHKESELSGSVLIDAGELATIESVDEIIDIIESDEAIEQIVFLGVAAKNDLADLIASRLSTMRKIITIEPDWSSVYALHWLYRQAHHVIFIDTMRVLDAAYSQCSCTLIAGGVFQADESFELLVRHLQRTACTVRNQVGDPIIYSSSNITSNIVGPRFLIAENQLSDLLLKMNDARQQVESEVETDWLQQFVDQSDSKVSGRVINHAAIASHSIDSIRDYKTRLVRKTIKLRHDPRGFLLDSNLRILKQLARLMPQKRA